jgi:hypothetical protein
MLGVIFKSLNGGNGHAALHAESGRRCSAQRLGSVLVISVILSVVALPSDAARHA